MIMAGTSASGPAFDRRMALTSCAPVKGCMAAAAMTRSGTLLAIASSGFGRALISLDAAGADRGEHGPHQRQDRPAIVDDGDNQRIEIAAEGAMVQHWVTWASR